MAKQEGLPKPPVGSVEIDVIPLPDESGSPATVGAAWTWQLRDTYTSAVLAFGDRYDDEGDARTAGEEAFTEFTT